jgi:hypothetical protein
MEGDTPIKLVDLRNMTIAEHETLLNNIRERRMKPVRVYEELTLLQDAARIEKLENEYDRHMGMFEKELAQLDKKFLAIEKRSLKLRGLKMEIEG